MIKPAETAEQVEVKTRSDLRMWLEGHCLQNQGVWLIKYKKPYQLLGKVYLPKNSGSSSLTRSKSASIF